MVLGAGIWTLGVIAVGVLTHADSDFQICDEGTTEKTVVEGSGETTEAVETSAQCAGLSVPQATVLLAPGLIFFSPALASLDIGGLFKLSFREVERKLDQQQKAVEAVAADVSEIRVMQQTIVQMGVTLNLNQNFGSQAREGFEQFRKGEIVSLEEALADSSAGDDGGREAGPGGEDSRGRP